jgi:hypothetical protein
MQAKKILMLFAIAAIALTSGCSVVGTSAQHASQVGLGSIVGGAAAYALSNKNPVTTGLGAMAGGAITDAALGEDPQAVQHGFDQGYLHGQSDAIKRQYFLRLALEQRPAAPEREGEAVNYVLPGPKVTADGRELAPHTVTVRVVE